MTFSALYKRYLDELAFFLQQADIAKTWEEKDAYRDLACERQTQANYIAHCIALFGDTELSQVKIIELTKLAEDTPCILCNPWTRGLATAQDGLA